MAANTARNLNTHYSRLATSTQRLSSGLRINSAADDAAGLAIRELQRADITALHQGARNANDAISMIQVADGALGIIDEKLIRMKELAEQAATGTYDSTQRLMIDSEFQAMASEIDRIARATDFNGIHLLDGSLKGKHNGSGLNSTGAMKIHFGSGNDSAEDYYYVEIGDCTVKGLGLGNQTLVTDKVTIYEEVTWTEQGQATFVPKTSFPILQDPVENNATYYTNGEYYFKNWNDPVGSALDPDGDKEIIDRLKYMYNYTDMQYRYSEFMNNNTGELYYTINRRDWVKDPDDTEIILPPPDLTNFAETNKDIIKSHRYIHYTDKNGKPYFSSDGIHFIDKLSTPNSIIYDATNPTHTQAIATLEPSIMEQDISDISIRYWKYKDPVSSKTYYSEDEGKTFYIDLNDPDGTKLDSVSDKEIIDRLKVVGNEKRSDPINFDVYIDRFTLYYTHDYKTYYLDYSHYPDDPALDSSNPADMTIINKLVPAETTHEEKIYCTAYTDKSGNLYYTYDNGKSYFTSLTDPENTKVPPIPLLTPSPGNNSTISFSYLVKEDPDTNKLYYMKLQLSGESQYVTDPKDPDSILDKNDPSNKAILDRLQTKLHYVQWQISRQEYIDPETGIKYYPYRSESTDKFVADINNLDDITLDRNRSADKTIIDRLVPVPENFWIWRKVELPEEYLVYKDPATNINYYKAGDKWITYPLSPYYSQMDENNPDHKEIINRLEPVITQITHSETIEHVIDGETHTKDGYYSIATQDNAQKALTRINDAIVQKDKIRAHLGALQNRLENTISNLNIQAENLQAAESRISDTDVATEMTEFVRNQILTQSAVAMLGQANSMPQMMMQLING